MRHRHWIAGLLVLAAGPSVAADGSLEAARRCAQVTDSLQRLVCYDRIFAAPAASAPAAAVQPLPAPAAPARPAPPVVAPPAVAAAPAAAAPAAATFGDEQLKRTVEERKREEGPAKQAGKVAALREARPGIWRITLENEQLWQQTESDRHFFIDVGDEVVIERGMLGSYHLEQADGGRRVRVTRLK